MSKLKRNLSSFAESTSMHGLPRIFNSNNSKIVRAFWLLVCIVAFAMFVSQVTFLLIRYYSYPIKVVTSINYEPVEFPTVTVCNMRNIRPEIVNKINRLFNENNNVRTVKDMGKILNDSSGYINRFMNLTAKLRTTILSSTQSMKPFLTRSFYAANIEQHYQEEASTELESFLVRCNLGEYECNSSEDFKRIFDPHYFNCFSFEPGTNGKVSEGLSNGFSAVFYTASTEVEWNDALKLIPGLYENNSPVGGSDGIRVIVHGRGTKPFPLSEGFDVPSGFSASIGLIPRKLKRLGEPYGKCVGNDRFIELGDKLEDGAKQREFYKYNNLHCQKICLQRFILGKCNCMNHHLPIPQGDHHRMCRSAQYVPNECIEADDEATISECEDKIMAINKPINCMKSATSEFMKNITIQEDCQCYPSCIDYSAEMTYSLSKWPAPGLETDMMLYDVGYESKFDHPFEMYWNLSWPDLRSKIIGSFCRVNVFIADSNILTTEEQPDYTKTQLVSDFGGQLGLWIGVSVIAACEVIELIYTILKGRHCKGGSKKTNPEDEKELRAMKLQKS